MGLTVRVRKRLERFTLDVDLDLPARGLHAVVGPSGAGKTTLLRLIAGLDDPDRGLVALGGQAWTDTAAGRNLTPWKRPVGMVFQEHDLFEHLTLWGNANFAAADPAHAQALMRSLGIWGLRRAYPGQVSGGERQRCAVCRALARRPELLLLDEPFSALDVVTRREMGQTLVSASRESGAPMLLVTHDIGEALVLADTVTALVEGRVSEDWLESSIEEMEREANRNRAILLAKHARKEERPCA